VGQFVIQAPFEDRMYTKQEIARAIDADEKTIDKMIAERRFPRGIKSGRSPIWSGDQLAAWWVNERNLISEKDAKPEKNSDTPGGSS
jgi:predicted DNA-binding transcriptional regulator AlpA